MNREVVSFERMEIELREDEYEILMRRQERKAIAAGIGFGLLLLTGIGIAITVVL